MKNNIVSFVAGLIFSVGLIVSGMTNPEKVKGFLDIFGNWDSSLVFVMLGAIGFNLISFKFILKRDSPVFSKIFFLPRKRDLDSKLITGAILFGIGWGLVGVCPGPAIVNVSLLDLNVFIFIFSMMVGMFLFRIFERPDTKS